MLPFLKKSMIVLFALALTTNATMVLAAEPASMDSELRHIELEWARIKYQVKGNDAQESQMRSLADEIAKIVERHPDRAEPLIWDGVVISSEAGLAGPFSALGLAKQAREMFEKAGRLDYRALDGAVPTSLGALYYMVPGFPLGFGDDDKARDYLKQGVAISPNGLDSNYFYGDFLFREGEYGQAALMLERGLSAPVDPERPVWDAGRRAEIKTLLAKVENKLASNR